MDSIRVSEAPDTGSIPVEATLHKTLAQQGFCYSCHIAKSNLLIKVGKLNAKNLS
jgi:hypothetical protein